jgi:hypothetical protein
MQSLFESALIKVPLSLFFAPIYLLIKFGHLIPEQRRVRVPFRSGLLEGRSLKTNYANALAYFMETALTLAKFFCKKCTIALAVAILGDPTHIKFYLCHIA